jgi:hypothetical protein
MEQYQTDPFSTSTTLEWGENMIDGYKTTINRGDLPSGLYFLKVYGDETFVLKLMIQ